MKDIALGLVAALVVPGVPALLFFWWSRRTLRQYVHSLVPVLSQVSFPAILIDKDESSSIQTVESELDLHFDRIDRPTSSSWIGQRLFDSAGNVYTIEATRCVEPDPPASRSLWRMWYVPSDQLLVAVELSAPQEYSFTELLDLIARRDPGVAYDRPIVDRQLRHCRTVKGIVRVLRGFPECRLHHWNALRAKW